jgi:hypothetical protein
LIRSLRVAGAFAIRQSKTIRAKPLERWESLTRCLDPRATVGPITFSRNLAPDFTHYSVNGQKSVLNNDKSKKAKTMKENQFYEK